MRRFLSVTLVLGCMVTSQSSVMASVQDTSAVGPGPQFLIAARKPAQHPVPVDVATVPALRRRISLRFDGTDRITALNAISRTAGLQFVYADGVVPPGGQVRLKAEEITVAAALSEVLMGAGVDVLIAPGGNIILIKRARAALAGSIEGRVTDAGTGYSVPAVEVLLEGTRWRTTSDSSGRYRLADVDSGGYVLTARRLGYVKQSRTVTVRDGQADTVDLALATLAIKLDELVTTATGQQRRRDLGNAITTIRADSVLQTAPIRNLTDLLESRVPGLTVQRTSGAPGDPARLRLRGIASAMRGNDPVVFVDGIRIYSTQSAERSGNLTNLGCPAVRANATGVTCSTITSQQTPGVAGNLPAPSPLDQIDPNIIETIDVFKGPSAVTLYGPDAANGVIVVTTKRGKPGPTQWTARIDHGRTTTPGQWPLGYYRWGTNRADGVPRTGICPLSSICLQDSMVRFQALNTPSLTILGQGRRTALSLTASGGNQALTYSITGSYSDEVGLLQLPMLEIERFRDQFSRQPPEWMRRPHHLTTWNVTSNVMARLGATADVTLFATLGRTDQDRTGLETKVSALASTYVDQVARRYYPTAGEMGIRTFNVFNDPTQGFLQDYYTRTVASSLPFKTALRANWLPKRWFTGSAEASVDLIPRDDERLLPTGLPTAADSGILIRGAGRSLVSNVNVRGQVHRPLAWGFKFQTNVGVNLTTTRTDDMITSATFLVPGTSSITGAKYILAEDNRVSSSVFGWYIEPQFIGQRISLSSGIRLDGGSNHGVKVRGSGSSLLSLPKLNGSWVISEEPWFPFTSLFSSLRLRGAYGQAQVQPGPTDRLRLYAGRLEDRLLLTNVGNTELRPERSTEVEGGIDADLLDSRISVDLTFYQKTQVDALMPVQLPLSVNGGGTVIQNVGNIRNRGLEAVLRLTPIQSPIVTWSAQLSYAKNSNMLVKLGRGVLPNKEQGLVEGYPIFGRWAKPILGYAEQNENGVLDRDEIQVGDSLVYMGRLMPDYTTALNTNVSLFRGAVGITALFSYESGATQIDQTSRQNWVLVRGAMDPTATLDEQAAILASTSFFANGVQNALTTYGLTQDISTFRFSSFSVRYTAPTRVARLLHAERLSVAVQGANLGLHSTYRGKDPNVTSWGVGENVVDTGILPQPRTWQLNLTLNY